MGITGERVAPDIMNVLDSKRLGRDVCREPSRASWGADARIFDADMPRNDRLRKAKEPGLPSAIPRLGRLPGDETPRLRDDVGKALRGGKAADRFGLDPAEFAVLGVEHRLPRDPARREGDDDEMTPRVAILVATDRLVVSGCADEFDGQSGLTARYAN